MTWSLAQVWDPQNRDLLILLWVPNFNMKCVYVCVCVCVHVRAHMLSCSVTQSGPTLCNPWTVAGQSPLSMGFSKQEDWSRLPFSPPGDLPIPGIQLVPPACLLYWKVNSLPLSHLGSFFYMKTPYEVHMKILYTSSIFSGYQMTWFFCISLFRFLELSFWSVWVNIYYGHAIW